MKRSYERRFLYLVKAFEISNPIQKLINLIYYTINIIMKQIGNVTKAKIRELVI
jgi:hypothetical protein